MKMNIWTRMLILFISLTFAPIVSALQSGPDEIIDQASKTLLVTLNQEKAGYGANPQPLYTRVRNQMRPITDISAIAKGIMGSYYKTATDSHKVKFRAAFERSLVKIYSDSLMKIDVKNFQLKPAAKLSANARKRKVVVTVLTHKGSNFLVSYSLLRNKQQQWLIRNIVVDGVNFGLTYRNQFKSEMARRNNNMDELIAHWSKIVEK